MTALLSPRARNVNFLLQGFAEKTEGVEHAFSVSSDGLLIAVSSNLPRHAADKMAAIIIGLQSLTQGAAVLLGSPGPKRVILDLHNCYLLVSMISEAAALGVCAAYDCDLGYVGYEMAFLTERVGAVLTPEIIAELRDSVQE